MNALTRALLRLGPVMFVGLFIAVAAFFLAPAASAQAEDNAIAVITETVDLATTDASISVPVVITANALITITSVSFDLDYDEDCVYISNVGNGEDGDVILSQSGFTPYFIDDPDNGKLRVVISDQDEPLVWFSTDDLLVIEFALRDACRAPGPHETIFGFSNATFGKGIDAALDTSADTYAGTYYLNVNRNPTAISFASGGAVAENTSGDREIATLTGTDPDDDQLAFAMASGCTLTYANDGFRIDPSAQTTLRTDRTFNFESQANYPICVQASDGEGGAFSTVITVTVTDANDTPTWIGLDQLTVVEGTDIGTAIGNLSTVDEDYPGSTTGSYKTYTYSIVDETDGAVFQVDNENDELEVKAAINYSTKSVYRVKIRTTDGGSASYEQWFTIRVLGKPALSLPNEPDVPYVVGTNAISVPVRYQARGNDVVTATFNVAYTNNCLAYTGFSPQSDFSSTGSNTDDGTANVVISSASAVLREGVLGYLLFNGEDHADCDPAGWTDLTISGVDLRATGNVATPEVTTTSGKLVVMDDDIRGNCNSDEALNAGDFTAIALENFDTSSETNGSSTPLDQYSWLWTPLGTFEGSAQGCDANADYAIGVSDITCAARLFFGLSCTLGRDGRIQAAQISAPASVVAAPGSTVSAPIALTANGNAVAAAAFTMQIDPALVFDTTDADADGVPDAVSFNTPAGFFKMVLYDAPTRRLQVLVAGLVMPLPVLPDGAFATVHLQGEASATGGAAPINLNDVSLGSVEGNEVEVIVAPIGMLNRVFLPAVER